MPTLLILHFITLITSGENYTSRNPHVSPPKATWRLTCNGPEEIDLRSVKPDSTCVECWTALLCSLKIYQARRNRDDCGLCTVTQETEMNGLHELGMCSSVQRQMSSSKTSVLTLLSFGTWGHVVFLACYRQIGEYCWFEFLYIKVGES